MLIYDEITRFNRQIQNSVLVIQHKDEVGIAKAPKELRVDKHRRISFRNVLLTPTTTFFDLTLKWSPQNA